MAAEQILALRFGRIHRPAAAAGSELHQGQSERGFVIGDAALLDLQRRRLARRVGHQIDDVGAFSSLALPFCLALLLPELGVPRGIEANMPEAPANLG